MQTETKEKTKGITSNLIPQRQSKQIDIRINAKQNIARNREKNQSNSNVELFTTNSISPISSITINSLLKREQFSDIDNIPKLIEDIYPLIKDDISIFFGTRTFTEETKPEEFIAWMLECYFEVNDVKNWAIEGNIDKYHLITFEDYDIEERGYSVSISFMESLYKKNKKAYNLLICFLSLLNNKLKVPFWFDDKDSINSAIEIIEEEIQNDQYEDVDTVKEVRKQIKKYESGIVIKVENDIKNRFIDIDDFFDIVNNYKPKKYINIKIKEFLLQSMYIFHYDVVFNHFVYININEATDNFPATPCNYAQIGWELDEDKCPVANHLAYEYQSLCENGDILPFRHCIIDNNDKDISRFPYDYVKLLDNFCTLEQEIWRGL